MLKISLVSFMMVTIFFAVASDATSANQDIKSPHKNSGVSTIKRITPQTQKIENLLKKYDYVDLVDAQDTDRFVIKSPVYTSNSVNYQSFSDIARYDVRDFAQSKKDLSKNVNRKSFNILRSTDYTSRNPVSNSVVSSRNVTQPRAVVANVGLSNVYNTSLGEDSENKKNAFREVSKYSWNKVDAMNVAFCESRYRTNALNHSSIERSLGLFQINVKAHSRIIPGNTLSEKLNWVYNPKNNVQFAYNLWQKQGWRPWLNCSRKLGII